MIVELPEHDELVAALDGVILDTPYSLDDSWAQAQAIAAWLEARRA